MEENHTNCDDNDQVGDIDIVGLNVDLYSNASSPDSKPEQVDITSDLNANPVYPYKCTTCPKKFKTRCGMLTHKRRIHNIGQTEDNYSVRCLEKECNYTFSYKEKLQQHLIETHGIEMDFSLKQFDSMQDFLRWKDEFEVQEKSRFVKKSGSRVKEEGVRIGYYYCSRSGSFTTLKPDRKSYKKKGSVKSKNCCTASITCVELADGKVEVKVCSTHYGHEYDLHHLRLTQSEKFQIAEQLVRGIPRELIVDNIRSTAGSNIDRIHLITLKDVKNVEKAYGITVCEKSDSGTTNLDTWVDSIIKTDNSPVLFYKTDGTLNTKTYYLCLVLLTAGQTDIISKFGTDGIFYVNTFLARNGTSYNSQCMRPPHIFVTTLLLVDDINEPCPVSFMISNNINEDKYLVFFESLKKRIPSMSAKMLLTDNQPLVFNKWCETFGQEPYHAWSNRFVDCDWRENLISVSDEDIQSSIYETLYSYLESDDHEIVENTLPNYITKLKENVVTKKFSEYFVNKYIGNENLWAGCYVKKMVSTNAQLKMELIYNEMVEMSVKKPWDRYFLVKFSQLLLKFVSDKQCVRHTKLQRHAQDTPNHHRLALATKEDAVIQISDTRWRVNSVKDPEKLYSIITKEQRKHDLSPCLLHCFKCDACAHDYSCSCKVYAYDRTMCKHIHAVCIKFTILLETKPEPIATEECSENYAEIDHPQSTDKIDCTQSKIVAKPVMPKRKRKKVVEQERDILPVIQSILLNRPYRNRGRPRKVLSSIKRDTVPIKKKKRKH